MSRNGIKRVARAVADYLGGYKLKYSLSSIASWADPRAEKHSDLDVVLATPETGWVLGGICKDLMRSLPGSNLITQGVSHLPRARAYFFAHHSLFPQALLMHPRIAASKTLVFFTHDRPLGICDDELIYVLNKSTRVFTMNSDTLRALVIRGVSPTRLELVLGAADDALFSPPSPGTCRLPTVGFCVGFRPHPHYRTRKNYDLIVEIVTRLNKYSVMIVGPGWRGYERFHEIESLPHVRYYDRPYSDYPQLYREMSVFVSASRLEGGPIPLIEAMMCDVVPVCSRTGFAGDLIQHGVNGYLFDIDASAEDICLLIHEALAVSRSVRATVKHLTWSSLARKVWSVVEQ